MEKTLPNSPVAEELEFVQNAKKFRTGIRYLMAYVLDSFFWAYSSLVCYKIIYQKFILALRFSEFNWDQPLYCLLFGLAIAIPLYFTKFSLGKALLGFFEDDKEIPFKSLPYFWWGMFILVITFVAGLKISQVSLYEFLSEGGLMGAHKIATALVNPNWSIFEDALFAAIETIYMAFIATAFALPFAFLTGFFAARNLMKNSWFFFSIYVITRFILNVTRSVEPIVWAIIFSVWVGIGPFAGMLALMVHSVSSLSKLYSEQIENIGEGPIEAMMATGAHPVQVVWFGVVPQIVLPYLSFTIYRWDINVRMATIIGLVGGGGIGTMLMQAQGLGQWDKVGLLAIVIAAIVWFMDYSSSKIREAIK